MPDVIMMRIDREINKEIVFAGRFIVIELESGVPIYNAMINVSKHFPGISKHFQQIIHKVDMGTTIEDAISEIIETTPSQNLRKMLWQVLNSIKTGSDIAKSMNSVIEQISKEQLIDVVEYGRKLNPLAMFYMIIAVIIPTLGVTMLIVLSTFISLELSLRSLLLIVFFLCFIQFMFLSIIRSSRPAVEI